jgi:germination protein M
MRRALLTTTLVLIASACGSGAPVVEGTVSDIVSSPGTSTPPSTGGGPTITYQVWFQRGETLWPVMRTGPRTRAVGAAAMTALLAGPTPTERSHGVGSIVPRDTRLLGLSVARGTATVDLSSEYQSGGGSLSVTMRLAQVVYTLTQFSTVRRVAFELDGRPVTVFSGEGLVLDRPQTRRDYRNLLPVIAVASPGFGQQVRSPVTVSGLANVFEANVSVEILDAGGRVLAKDFTTASCGTGCWGTYSLDLAYHVGERQRGTVVVHDDDAAGTGTYPHEERIPVVLMP